MSLGPALDTLETDRLILRHRRVNEAAIYRQLWTERDPRVPPHRWWIHRGVREHVVARLARLP
jgi:hypothetical protein